MGLYLGGLFISFFEHYLLIEALNLQCICIIRVAQITGTSFQTERASLNLLLLSTQQAY